MEELLQAVTGLINTGGALADDALYLYFIFKITSPFAVTIAFVGVAHIICKTIITCTKLGKEP